MKKWVLLICLCLPLTAAAQPGKNFLRLLRNNSLTSRLQQNLERALARTRISSFLQPHAISKFILTATPLAPARPTWKDNVVLTPGKKEDWLNHYRQTLARFEQLKKESASFLYYQSVPLEAREISAQEKRHWLDKMLPLYNQVYALYVNTQEDASLKYALDYLRYGISMVDPFLVSTLPRVVKPYAAAFDTNAFFLYPKNHLSVCAVDLGKKRIVIINDDRALLEHFERLVRIGVLFPHATVHTEGDVMQFLLWLQNSSARPDIVFTDIQLGNNNGYYIARQLRERGYSGGIIALTSYDQTEEYARQLAQAGFDGMVSLDEQYYRNIHIAQRLTEAAQMYLQEHVEKQ